MKQLMNVIDKGLSYAGLFCATTFGLMMILAVVNGFALPYEMDLIAVISLYVVITTAVVQLAKAVIPGSITLFRTLFL